MTSLQKISDVGTGMADSAKTAAWIAGGALALWVGYNIFKCYKKHHSLSPVALIACTASDSFSVLKGIGKGLGKEALKTLKKLPLKDMKKISSHAIKDVKKVTHKLGHKAKKGFKKVRRVFH